MVCPNIEAFFLQCEICLPLVLVKFMMIAFKSEKAPDRKRYQEIFFFENICCGYSLEVPWQGTSNEYPQQMFS